MNINQPISDCQRLAKHLLPEYTWDEIITLGLERAKSLEQQKMYRSLQKPAKQRSGECG